MTTRTALLTVPLLLVAPGGRAQALGPGSPAAGPFGEQVRWSRLPDGVRVFVNAPAAPRHLSRRLVVYATPNGNTIEQTLGCRVSPGLDWHYDLQHVAAQVRRLREVDPTREVVLAVVQAPKLSWPAWRAAHADANARIRVLVATLRQETGADQVALTGHSGGGAFLFGYLEAGETIPPEVERIVFLDANYSWSDDLHHHRLLTWLRGDPRRHLVTIAYDDRAITYQGQKVVGPDGGTWRATQRMIARARGDLDLTESTLGPFARTTALDGQWKCLVHPNPENKILHTALVGELNGLLWGLTVGTPHEGGWGQLGGPRAYTTWVQDQPFVEPPSRRAVIATGAPPRRLNLPDRPADAPTGSQFLELIRDLPRAAREAACEHELLRGNVPDQLRLLVPLRLEVAAADGPALAGVAYVMGDYLGVGRDDDWVRVPLSPRTALAVGAVAGGTLLTRQLSDDVFAAAAVRLDPRPLTVEREAAATFHQHHRILEEQLGDRPRGQLTAGIKKDVVWTNRLTERAHTVAIYGWHQADGRPLQPLYVGHVDWYVDYSHGIRLLADALLVDGQPRLVDEVLANPRLCQLLSDEGPLDLAALRRAAGW